MSFFENSFFKRKQKEKKEPEEKDVFTEIENMPGTRTLKMTKPGNEEEIKRWIEKE